TPGNDSRLVLDGELMFHMGAAPEPLWDALQELARVPSARDSALIARLKQPIPRDRLQPQIPLTLQLDSRGGVRADTSLRTGGGPRRVMLERVDTLSIARPF